MKFSVVVPTHCRPAPLARCLQALAGQDFPKNDFEVIVVDDGGAIPAVSSGPGCVFQLLRQDRRGPAAARNAGAAIASGEFLAFTDDDCRPAPDWLACLAALLAGTPDELVGGPIVNDLTENPFSTASDLLLDYLYRHYSHDGTGPAFLATCNLAMRRSHFDEIGRFDERFPIAAGEDREFCDRWRYSGRRIRFASGAVVHHAHSMEWRGFMRQHFNYGRGAWYFRRARARRNLPGPRIEPLRFYLGILRSPFILPRPAGPRVRMSALLALSQIVYAAGFLREVASANSRR